MSNVAGDLGCGACANGVDEPFPFSMAFQPIVDLEARRVFAYEALARGPLGQPSATVMKQITDNNRYQFDQNCRVKALELAVKLNLTATGAKLAINFMPGAVYNPVSCIQVTLHTARRVGFPLDRIIFEITESEKIIDRQHLLGIIDEYRRHGFTMAIDDFGAGYAGLNVMAEMRVEIVKLDMDLIRGINRRPAARTIVQSMVELCRVLDTTVIAEGVETMEELAVLRRCGVNLMQGYLFARPEFESLPEAIFPDLEPDSEQSALTFQL